MKNFDFLRGDNEILLIYLDVTEIYFNVDLARPCKGDVADIIRRPLIEIYSAGRFYAINHEKVRN